MSCRSSSLRLLVLSPVPPALLVLTNSPLPSTPPRMPCPSSAALETAVRAQERNAAPPHARRNAQLSGPPLEAPTEIRSAARRKRADASFGIAASPANSYAFPSIFTLMQPEPTNPQSRAVGREMQCRIAHRLVAVTAWSRPGHPQLKVRTSALNLSHTIHTPYTAQRGGSCKCLRKELAIARIRRTCSRVSRSPLNPVHR